MHTDISKPHWRFRGFCINTEWRFNNKQGNTKENSQTTSRESGKRARLSHTKWSRESSMIGDEKPSLSKSGIRCDHPVPAKVILLTFKLTITILCLKRESMWRRASSTWTTCCLWVNHISSSNTRPLEWIVETSDTRSGIELGVYRCGGPEPCA